LFVSRLSGELDGEEDGLAKADVEIDGDDESELVGVSEDVVLAKGNTVDPGRSE
jgi:hypothetical protein